MPGRAECEAEGRKVEDMERDYLENLQKNKTPQAMAAKAKLFNSIKGPLIIPIPDVLHIVPPGLHISLKVGLAIVKLLEKHCDILDEEAEESELATVGDEIFREEQGLDDNDDGEEVVEGKDTDDDHAAEVADNSDQPGGSGGVREQEQEHGQGDEGLEQEGATEGDQEIDGSGEVRARFDLGRNRGERDIAGQELEAAVEEVERRQEEVQVLATKLLERKVVLKRISLNLVEDWDGVEALSKTHAKYIREIRTFKFCGDLCLLTRFDHCVKKLRCTDCNKECHQVCGLLYPRVEGEVRLEQLCLECRGVGGYEEMRVILQQEVEGLRNLLTTATTGLEVAVAVQRKKQEVLSQWLGPHRRHLQDLLEQVLQVVKTQYQGGMYVGAHVHKILVYHERLSEVLVSKPQLRQEFNLFCSYYLTAHHIMKRATWIKPEEVTIFHLEKKKK